MGENVEVTNLSKQMRGAFSEAAATTWLIAEGYQVYQQVGLCLVDLLAYHVDDRRVVRVEVKSATRHVIASGETRFYWSTRENQMDHVDLFLVVTDDGRVFDATGIESPIKSSTLDDPVASTGVKGRGQHLGRGRAKDVLRDGPVLDEDGNKRY